MRITTILGGIAALAATATFAHQGVKDAQVRARMQHMEMIAQKTKVLGTMAKGETAFDPETANETLATLATIARDIPDHFETQAQDPLSEARETIWDEWEQFHAMSLDLADAAATEIAVEADLRPVLAEVGAACRACHESYRD